MLFLSRPPRDLLVAGITTVLAVLLYPAAVLRGQSFFERDLHLDWYPRLEALARGKQAAEARETLERLATEYSGQANAALYLAIASYVRDAGDAGGAIDILVAGDERFPEESEKFEAAIQELHQAGSMDPAEIERLKSLGYL